MSMTPHFDKYEDWVEHHQGTECALCYGRGWVMQEDSAGMPTHEIACPYCHGQRSAGWVVERRQSKFNAWDKRRNLLIIATVAAFVWPYLGLFVIAGWVAYWINRRPKEEKPGYHSKHAPGFTDEREQTALGIFAAGVGIRSLFGRKR
jgi:hypothetical protein